VWRNEPSHPNGVPLWELESRWTPKSLKDDCKGQNSMAWVVLYIIGKLLERRYLKWACIAHLDIWNTSDDQKKGRESNWQFDSWPLKIGNWPDFRACRWRATYRWKALDEGYNFTSDLISIESLLATLWCPKVAGIPTLAISRLPLGSLETKTIWMWAPWRGAEYTIRKKVVASPKFRLWWVLYVRVARGSS
jgi:hypothetical protein